MISSIKHKQSISWTFLNDAMAISAKELPKNHTDKERFAAALSCTQTRILTLLFPRKRRRSSPSPFISHRVLEAVASWILKSLICTKYAYHLGPPKLSSPSFVFRDSIYEIPNAEIFSTMGLFTTGLLALSHRGLSLFVCSPVHGRLPAVGRKRHEAKVACAGMLA